MWCGQFPDSIDVGVVEDLLQCVVRHSACLNSIPLHLCDRNVLLLGLYPNTHLSQRLSTNLLLLFMSHVWIVLLDGAYYLICHSLRSSLTWSILKCKIQISHQFRYFRRIRFFCSLGLLERRLSNHLLACLVS